MNRCKLTECQGKPRCDMCNVMDLRYSSGWREMLAAPKDAGPVLLLVPTRWAKRATHLQVQGEWFNDCWHIFNSDEAVQRVQPIGWRPLLPWPSSMPPNVRVKPAPTVGRAGQQAQNGPQALRLMASATRRWGSA